MTPSAVIALLGFLDELFQLGGKLIETAMEKTPELNMQQLPQLDAMDKAREEALLKTSTVKQ